MVDLPMLLTRHTDLLLTTVTRLDDASAPSLCVGWTRSHVLTHLARNADGLAALVRAGLDGTGETMYLSESARDEDIEAGADRGLHALVSDLQASGGRLDQSLSRLPGADLEIRVERTPGGATIPLRKVPFLRLREVVYHHVDLDAGFGFADVEPELVELFLSDEYARLGLDGAQQAKAADLLWRARGIREERA